MTIYTNVFLFEHRERPIIRVVTQCSHRYPFEALWKVSMQIVAIAEEMKGVFIPECFKVDDVWEQSNCVLFTVNFPDKHVAKHFCEGVNSLKTTL